jgi:hypothetical protein
MISPISPCDLAQNRRPYAQQFSLW